MIPAGRYWIGNPNVHLLKHTNLTTMNMNNHSFLNEENHELIFHILDDSINTYFHTIYILTHGGWFPLDCSSLMLSLIPVDTNTEQTGVVLELEQEVSEIKRLEGTVQIGNIRLQFT